MVVKSCDRCIKQTMRNIDMRQFSLFAICLVLSLCGTVSAQHALVEYKEKDDPCARFKMRILVPGNHADVKLRAHKLKDGIDYKMVWNPCPQPEPQFAFVLNERARDRLGKLPVQQSFGVQMSTAKSGKKKHAEFPFPKHLSPFDKWLQ
jgi:hypothetical protein